jgi:D-serine deaminase-like pyridoxal phosphate-dependent protein
VKWVSSGDPVGGTPFLVVDRSVLERNLHSMQRYCDGQGLALRPHVKTHKTNEIVRMQIALGAAGVTCQKLGEVEALELDDVGTLISFNLVGRDKLRRLAAAATRARVSVTIDDVRVARAISSTVARSAGALGVWVDCDTGLGRTGVGSSREALALAQAVQAMPGLELRGLFTYPLPPEGSWLEQAVDEWARAGLAGPAVSVGATPTAFQTHTRAYATELRVGTYVFNDLECVEAGSARIEDCALTIRATCVSRSASGRAVIDAGSKAIGAETVDLGDGPVYGAVRDRPDLVVIAVYEEHGVLRTGSDEDLPDLGETVEIVPAHCCYAVNLHDQLRVEAGGVLVDVWKILARGAVT